MVNKSSVRAKNKENFIKCVEFRKQGLSYTEIRKIVPVAKSTINNWLTLAGLTLTAEHLKIQRTKRLQNHVIATEASRITRARKADQEINKFIQEYKRFLNDPFFVAGIILYEAEGSKTQCVLSNSDYRVMQMFVTFIEKFFYLDRTENMHFRVYIHETRSGDLDKIRGFWSKKLNISAKEIALSWKKNIVIHSRENPDYVGQLSVFITGVPLLTRKLRFISDIILKKYCRIV